MLLCCQGGQTGDGDPIRDEDSSEEGVGTTNGNSQNESDRPPTAGGLDNTVTTGDDGSNANGDCHFQRTPITSLNVETQLGFSAQDILDFATTPSQSPLLWKGSSQLSFGPEAGVSALQLDIQHAGGAVFLRDSQQGECASALELDVVMTLQSAGGALSETFITTLVAESKVLLTFEHSIDAQAVAGSFQVLATQPAGGVLEQLTVSGTMSPQGSCGAIDATLSYQPDETLPSAGLQLSGYGTVALWPADSDCEFAKEIE